MDDAAPPERWNVDILSEEGFVKMSEVANEVKTMVAQH
jgi:hypothetical protein